MITVKDYKQDFVIGQPLCCAFGFFDGIHLGHMAVLDATKHEEYRRAVLTFNNRPMNYVNGYRNEPNRLMTNEEKDLFLENLGFDYVFTFDFNEEIMNMSKEEFVREFIVRYNIKKVICGSDFTFGKNREGNVSNFPVLLEPYGIQLEVVDDVHYLHEVISSTEIRNALRKGDVVEARQMLGRFYTIRGTVVSGQHIGTSLGFATANLVPPEDMMLPVPGVYLTRCTVEGETYHAVTNIGTRPTVSASGNITVESHLMDCSEDLYGKSLKVEFMLRLRDEVRFESTDDLVEQVNRDIGILRDFVK